MRLASQIVLVGLMVIGFFMHLYWDINGRPAREPSGFAGILGTFAIYAVTMTLWWYSGAFATWFQ